MVLADLGRKITNALRSLNNSTIINEEVGIESNGVKKLLRTAKCQTILLCLCSIYLPFISKPSWGPIQFIP